MAYKRYIYKDGKRFGPYYYESRKEKGKVISTYIGKDEKEATKRGIGQKKNKSNIIMIIALFLLMANLVNLFFLINSSPTGKIIFQFEGDSEVGQELKGNLQLNIKQGELIPADTRVIVKTSDETKEFLLKDLVLKETTNGDFYLRGKSLSGSGEGYGVKGQKNSFPEVDFVFRIVEKNTEEPIVEEVTAQNQQEIMQESNQDSPIKGRVKKDDPFTYELKQNQEIEIISSSQPINFNTENNLLAITTDYSTPEEGFGEKYLLDNDIIFYFNLENLDLIAKPGKLEIRLVYDEEELVSATKFYNEEKLLLSGKDLIVETTQEKAKINEPVEWEKQVRTAKKGKLVINLPKQAEDIKAFKFGVEVSLDSKEKPNTKEITIDDDALQYEIQYKTPAPHITEKTIDKGKEIKAIGSDEVHYEDVLVSTSIPEAFNLKNPEHITIYWIEQNQYIAAEKILDKNSDGVYDYLEFIAPSLSNQTFKIEIVITGAEHLDKQRQFVADIYKYVNETDQITYTIPKDEYVRAYFETNLTKENFIDFYVTNINPATVEIYEKDSSQLIESIDIKAEGQYYVNLSNLASQSQSVFDLKSVNGEVIYDYVHDAPPIKFGLLDDFSLIESVQNLQEGQTLTIQGNYRNVGDGSGSWTIQLRSLNSISATNNLDGVCSVGEGFRVISVVINSCGKGAICNGIVSTGVVEILGLVKNVAVTATWTLGACPGSSSNSPYTISTIKIAGDQSSFNLRTPTISVYLPNSPPTITYVANIPEQTPLEATTRQVGFFTRVIDLDGYSDITNVRAEFSRLGEPTRSDTSCSLQSIIDVNTGSYWCLIDMFYYDQAGVWNVLVEATDSQSQQDIDVSQSFNYITLKGIMINAPIGLLNWPPLNPGQTNIPSGNDPSVIENTGNYEGSVFVTARNLVGESSPSQMISADLFRVAPTSGIECNPGQSTPLQDSTPVVISGSFLARGAGSTQELYYCLTQVPSVYSQTYSARGLNNWVIEV